VVHPAHQAAVAINIGTRAVQPVTATFEQPIEARSRNSPCADKRHADIKRVQVVRIEVLRTLKHRSFRRAL